MMWKTNKMEKVGKIDGENAEEVCAEDDQQQIQDDTFVWDESSQLYYHARSGFYHDPNAGWYYSTIDGFYYKFEDGNYTLLDSNKDCHFERFDSQVDSADGEMRVHQNHELECDPNDQGKEDEANHTDKLRISDPLTTPNARTFQQQHYSRTFKALAYDEVRGGFLSPLDLPGLTEGSSSEIPINQPPTSEWLEDTLIELYLSGYANAEADASMDPLPHETEGNDEVVGEQYGGSDFADKAATTSSADVFGEETSWEEECWKAQYGQVVQQEEAWKPEVPVVDIWDWSLYRDFIYKETNCQVARLLGTLVQPSSKLHPSMPAHGGRFKSAPICKVHLDFVQVRSGQIYKLRSPNAGYLATLSTYDASNPTKEWGFPDLSIHGAKGTSESGTSLRVFSKKSTSSCLDKPSVSKKHKTHAYRDRAAERRAFHREFGVIPGEDSADDMISPLNSPSDSTEGAAAAALEMSLGSGSYAQKLLKNMGWKEGEGLGKERQGLREPLQGIGNKGTAGLGWHSGRSD